MDSTEITAKTAKKEVFQRGKTVMRSFVWGSGEL